MRLFSRADLSVSVAETKAVPRAGARSQIILIAAAAVLVMVGACSPPPDAAPASSASAASAEVSAASEVTAPKPATANVALDGEGLRLVNPTSGATRLLAFGTPESDVIALLVPILGPVERGRSEDCNMDFAAFEYGLALHSVDGQFRGWALSNKSEPPLTTMAGLTIGSTRTELEGPVVPTIEESTLGLEFLAAGISGLLSGPEPSATVTNLWAGEACVFR